MKNPSEDDVGAWMAQELAERGLLRQRDAAKHIAEEFGEDFLFTNNNGNPGINPGVLAAFHARTGDTKEWKGYPRFAWQVRAEDG